MEDTTPTMTIIPAYRIVLFVSIFVSLPSTPSCPFPRRIFESLVSVSRCLSSSDSCVSRASVRFFTCSLHSFSVT